MAEMTIEAALREGRGKNEARRLRRQGQVPGIVYGGKKVGNVAVAVTPKALNSVLHTGRNTIFTLNVRGGGHENVMIKDFQTDPVRETFLHADFMRIAMDELLRVTVAIHHKGEPRGVKTQGGILEFVLREVAVECLPADIPDFIEIDVSDLDLNAAYRVSDLPVSSRVRILEDPSRVVIHVVTPQAEVEAPAAAVPEAEAPTTAEPEVIKKGKKEEEEPAG